ncbi:MAG: glycosyltransferase [Pirellula sp.]
MSRSINQQADLELVPFAIQDERTKQDIHEWLPLTPKVFPIFGSKKIAYAPGMLKSIATFQPDLIHQYIVWQYPAYAANRAQQLAKIPLILSTQGMLEPWAVKNQGIAKRIALHLFQRRQLVRNVSCLHAVSEREVDTLRGFGCKAPVCVVPNGVETDEFDPSARDEYYSPNGRPYILFLSRLHPKKGVESLIKGWAKFTAAMREPMKGLTLVIAGWDENNYRQKLIEEARNLGIPFAEKLESWTDETSLVFAGATFGNRKSAALANCKGFILPSASEGLPIAVLEAWGNRKAVMMTDGCNIPEGFDAHAALRIASSIPPDQAVFAALTTWAAMTEEQRDLMGNRGKELVDRVFNWRSAGQQMASVYQWLLGRSDKPLSVREYRG